jgi:hypothetical protein
MGQDPAANIYQESRIQSRVPVRLVGSSVRDQLARTIFNKKAAGLTRTDIENNNTKFYSWQAGGSTEPYNIKIIKNVEVGGSIGLPRRKEVNSY